jgi:phage baseplate assembly protein W
MSFGFGPSLPISFNDTDGISLIKTSRELVKQNFKNLILTNPGERIMDSKFGVGVYKLFEGFSEETKASIHSRILQQVLIYLPYIEVKKIDFEENEAYPNGLLLRISYFIKPLSVRDVLEIK